MLFLLLVVFVLAIIVLQYTLARHSKKYLRYESRLNTMLVEPDEELLFSSYVSNYSGLPIFYCGLREHFCREARVCEDEKWKKKYVKSDMFGDTTNYHFFLMPHKILVNKVHLSFPSRGVYKLGRYMLETGDFLGLKTDSESLEIEQSIVVMPRRAEDAEIMRVLSGYLGDDSVRRFILEDPVLAVGFREYTGREPMKSIAWKQSARSQKLYVKEYDYTSEKRVGVILNLEKASEEDIERCFEVTRTVCEELEKEQITYDFFTNGKLIGPIGAINWLPEGLGTAHLNSILYAMGKSSGICISSFENLLDSCKRKRKTAQGYIIITPHNLPEYRGMLNEFRAACGQEICVIEGGEQS